jgi:16S rRNA (uracil1498-N3)-methyltransferase
LPYFFAERRGGRAAIRGADARHLARSLRARAGEQIQVVDPAGWLLTVRVDMVTADLVEGAIIAEAEHHSEPEARVVVGIANLPASSLELVLSRCTEVGAAAFHIILADRSIARGAKSERWKTICREAAMLAGRLRVPEVRGPSPLEEVIAAEPRPVMLVRGASLKLAQLQDRDGVTLLIGPEGGWTDRELEMVQLHATLGPRNLRADTAAVVAVSLALRDDG